MIKDRGVLPSQQGVAKPLVKKGKAHAAALSKAGKMTIAGGVALSRMTTAGLLVLLKED